MPSQPTLDDKFDVKKEIDVKKEETPTGDTKPATDIKTESAGAPLFETNFNCGPTSLMPVWRLQTIEEQRELLALDQKLTKSDVKHEVEEILGVGDASAAGAPTATAGSLESVSVIHYMTFGFPNPLVGRHGRDGSLITNQLIFNARSEGITEKKMWAALVHRKRCVVLVDGFFEFHTEMDEKTGHAARKQPYFFHMKASDGQPPTIAVGSTKKAKDSQESPFPTMYLAAVYDAAIDDSTGQIEYSFCILTCAPSKEMRPIHNRMPVVLTRSDAEKWLDVDRFPFDQLQPLLKPYEGLAFYKVPPVVNNARNHGVECIEPLDQFEKRTKASGIGRFFSPKAKTTNAATTDAPTAATSDNHPTSGGLASTITATASDASMDSFFNVSGKPGQLFQSSRVNPADPGQTTGDLRTATTAPSTETSDVAMEAEMFVRQVKGEVKSEETKDADEEDALMANEGADRKRKQPHESAVTQPHHAPVKSEEEPEQAAKRHKPTAAERAHATKHE